VTNGLPSNTAVVAHEDETGALWILTDRGLSRFKDGCFANISSRQGLHNDVVLALLDDQIGNYWFNSNQGIFRAAKKELNEVADGVRPPLTVCAMALRMARRTSRAMPTAGPTPAGRQRPALVPHHWRSGRYQPKGSGALRRSTPVLIEQVLANEHALPFQPERRDEASEPFQIAPVKAHPGLPLHRDRIQRAGEGQVKYRLDGHQTHWIDAGNQRFAVYAGLAPGPYVFRVLACNRRASGTRPTPRRFHATALFL